MSEHVRSCFVCLRETSCHALYTTHTRADIAYRERTPKYILEISEKFKEMDDIKLFLNVEKHRELYDPQQQVNKDNVG